MECQIKRFDKAPINVILLKSQCDKYGKEEM